MKRKQLTAILLSAILSFSACVPLNGISAFAAEDTESQTITEEAAGDPGGGDDGGASGEETVPEEAGSGAMQVEVPAEGTETGETPDAGAGEDTPDYTVPAAEEQEEVIPQEDPAGNDQTVVSMPEQETNDAADAAGGSVQDNENNENPDNGQQVDPEVPAEGQNGDPSEGEPSATEDFFTSATEIRAGESFDVSLTDEGPSVCFKFIPEEDMIASFSSVSDFETYVNMYDADYAQMRGESGASGFNLTYSFTGGNVYYFEVGADFSGEAAFSVSLARLDYFYVDHSNEGYVYTDDPEQPVTLHVNATSDTGLTYSWYVNDELVQEGEADSYTFTPAEKTEVRCEIQDQNDQSESVYFTVAIIQDWWIEAVGGDRIPVEAGQSQVLEVSPFFREENQIPYSLTYTWKDGEGNILQESSTDASVVSYTVPEVNGAAYVLLTVSDQYGNQGDVEFSLYNPGRLNVYPDGTHPGVESADCSCDPGGSVYLHVVDGTSGEIPVHYTWYNENDEILDGSEDNCDYQLTDVQESRTIRCHAEDDEGNNADLYFHVRVNSYLTAYPEGANEGDTEQWIDITGQDAVTLRTIAENSAGRSISYQWKMRTRNYDSYDWPEEWTEIPGATEEAYTVGQPRCIDQYCCVVQDEDLHSAEIVFNLQTSASLSARPGEDYYDLSAVIDVSGMEEILLAPYIEEGDADRITYQWAHLNGQEEQVLEGETGSSYMVSGPENGNTYICTVRDSYGNQVRLEYHFRQDNHLQAYISEDERTTAATIDPGSSESFTFTPYVQADDMSQLQYSWRVKTAEGEESDAGHEATLFIDHQPENDTTYYFTVSDQYGNSAEVTYYFQVDTHLVLYPEGTPENLSSVHRVIAGEDSVTLTAIVNADEGTNITWQWYKNYEYMESESGSMQSTGSDSLSIEAQSPADGDVYVLEIHDDYGNNRIATFYLDEEPPALNVYPDGGSEGDTRAIIPFTANEAYWLRVWNNSNYELFGMSYDWRDPAGNSITETDDGGTMALVERPYNGDVYTCTVTDSYGQTATVEFEFQYQRQEGDPTDEDMENARGISVGDSVDVSVTDENPVAWFRFTPEDDGEYELYAESEDYVDTYATLYDAAGMPVTQVDSGADNGGFDMLESFKAGETCYFGVREYGNTGAAFTIHLVSGEKSDWLSDYGYYIEEDRIQLNGYHGEETNVTVPGSAYARGKEYHTIVLSDSMWNDTDVSSLSFEKGIVFPEYSSYIFGNMKKLISVDMSEADLSNVRDINAMFTGCGSLESVDLGGVDLSSVETASDIFTGCNRLQTIEAPVGLSAEAALPRTYLDSEGNKYTSLPMNLQTSITLTKLEESEWLADYTYGIEEDAITLYSYTGKDDNILVPGSAHVGDKEYSTINLSNGMWNEFDVHTLKLEAGVVLPDDCSHMFDIRGLETIDLSAVDMSNVVAAAEMFGGGTDLEQIDSPKNAAVAAALPVPFADESGNIYSILPQGQAESLKLTRVSASDWLAEFNYQIEGEKIRLTSYQGTEENKDLTIPGSAVVGGKEYNTIEIGNGVWKNNGNRIAALHFEEGVSIPEDCTGLFENLNNVTAIDLSAFDWSNVTKMDRLFADCFVLSSLDLQAMDTGKVTSMSGMFQNCNSLNALDLSSLDTANVTDMSDMFNGCGVESLDLSGFDTRNVTTMNEMFAGCWNLNSLNIEGLDTGNVTDMNSMFYNCYNLETIDLTGLDTGKVTDMSEMFQSCNNAKTINLSGLDLSSVKDMSYMFEDCGSITELDMSGHDMSSVENMEAMFDSCWELASLDLHGCDASAVTTMCSMFRSCSSLTDLNMKDFQVKAVTDMSHMFRNCYNLTTLDLGSLKPEKVTNIRSMFRGCDELTELNISGIDASGVEHAGSIFKDVTKLARIEAPTNLAMVINLPVVYEGSNGALYGTLPRARSKSLTLIYARDLKEGESGDPVPAAGITLARTEVTYNGSAQKPAVTVRSGDMDLREGTDYTVAYSNNTNAGTATVTVTGKGTFTGTNKKTFKIKAAAIAASGITVSTFGLTYNGSAKKPAVTVKSGNKTLKSGTDYTVAYKNNTNAGNATATVTGKGNYSGTVNKTFKIAKAAQSITVKAAAGSVAVGKTTTVSISGAKGTKAYKSSNTAVATVTSAGKVTAKKVGTVKITVTSNATTNYNAASKTVTIKVVPAATSKLTGENPVKGIKLTWAKVAGANGYIVYRNNKAIKTITNGSTVTYTDAGADTNGTKYVYKIVAKGSTGNSTLSRSLTFYRVARPAISSVKNSASKKATVKWGKNAKATGYQIQYGLKSNFSGAKTVTIGKAGTVSRVISSLSKNKTYYFRIRTYKKVGKVTYYSMWSAAKSLKIKK